jgi:hypothetical protein
MSLIRLIESRKIYARQWKIVWWTLGMTVGVYLIADGKSQSEHPLDHALIGAALGLLVGFCGDRTKGDVETPQIMILRTDKIERTRKFT